MFFKSICIDNYTEMEMIVLVKFKAFDYKGGRALKRWRAPRIITVAALKEAVGIGIQALAVRKQDRYAWQEEQIAKAVLQFLENVMIQAHIELPRDEALALEDAINDDFKELYADMEVIQDARENYGMNRKMSKKAKLLSG
mgnify:CR=1 FL=1|tara:strand:+ start:576 stop:998 length:423 start_codon:yes stop_codon:yes gene_type:complete